MNPMKKTYSLVLATVVSVGMVSDASADRYRHLNVRYDQIIQHSQDLEYIASHLKECFRDEFRQSRLYGKLVSKANRIRNRARSLHRHGLSRGSCNWQNEIQQLDELVCALRSVVDEAVQRSRYGYDGPICSNAIRTVNRLLGKADWHVKGLQKAIFQVHRPVYSRPNFDRVNPRPFCGTPPWPGLSANQNGFGFNVGGFNFYVDR